MPEQMADDTSASLEPNGGGRPDRSTPRRPTPRGTILAGAFGLGVAGDLLLREATGLGLNLYLLFVVLATVLAMVLRRAGLRPALESVGWMAAGLLLAGILVMRASPALQAMAFLAASAAFALPALRSGAAWLRGCGVGDVVEAIGSAVVHAGLGPLRLVLARSRERPENPEGPGNQEGSEAPVAWALLRGLLLALPLLFVFGALFMSADRVFADLVTGALGGVEIDVLISRILVVGVLAWLASGYLAGFVTGTRVRQRLASLGVRPSLGILEIGTVLSLVNLLFTAFVLVQLQHLFGGSARVEVTPGLTYSDYAREGFVQLALAAGLVLPCLLAADWLLRREQPRDARTFQVLGGLQLLLLAVVMASAGQRVRVYQEAYGLTESRFYGSAFLIWLTLVGAWFAFTVLRGRRDRFAGAAVVSAFVLVAILGLVNPDERIARSNLTRAGVTVASDSVDAAYLGSLSADAVPTLLEGLPALSPEARCTLAVRLQARWGAPMDADWRSWNRAKVRARRLVGEAPADLLSTEGCPGPRS